MGEPSRIDHASVGQADDTVPAPPRPPDARALDDLLGLLARAVQQVQTYPPSSPICLGTIEGVHRGLEALAMRDRLACRVTPSELLVDDVPAGGGTAAARELATRLHRAAVATVTFVRGASVRELARFCDDVVRCSARRGTTENLLELLTEHGVEHVQVEMAPRPEIFHVGAIADATAETLAHERARMLPAGARGAAVQHLYPPHRGWVRLDPASGLSTISLLDLTILARDPATLASMLMRLTDDEADVTPERALQAKYSDVARLIAALDPPVARRLFARLARAVLDLDAASRQALLRRTVLPGLLDGRIDGAILRDFPDVELAESLCLLLDLETAAPELLATALSRLDLSDERRAAVTPLLDARLQEREASLHNERQAMLVKHARELVRVDPAQARSFAEFSAFDLSVDDSTLATLAAIRETVPAGDVLADQLTCLWHLLALEPNPASVCRFLDRSFGLLDALERAARGRELARWLAGYRDIADRLRPMRPDVADAIADRLTVFCTPARAAWLLDLVREDADDPAAAAVLGALGSAVAPSLAGLLERGASGDATRDAQERGRAAGRLLVQYAPAVAPGIPALLEASTPGVRRILLRVLGSAGSGYEDHLAPYAAAPDDATAREALRGLARIGTPKAAAMVVAQIARQDGALSVAAEETLWHFPLPEAERRTRDLLARRDFTLNHPEAAERLLDRAARSRRDGLDPVLQELAALRFRIWSPAVARVARKAHRLLQSEA